MQGIEHVERGNSKCITTLRKIKYIFLASQYDIPNEASNKISNWHTYTSHLFMDKNYRQIRKILLGKEMHETNMQERETRAYMMGHKPEGLIPLE